MTLIQKASARALLPQYGQLKFDAYITVLDVQPALNHDEAQSALTQQCAECNLVSFLRGIADGPGHGSLSGLGEMFASLPALAHALARRRGDEVLAIARRMGTQKVWEIVHPGERPELGLPCAHVHDPGLIGSTFREGDLLVISPEQLSEASAHAQVARLVRRGAQRVLLGYLEHARAMDRFGDFMERGSLHELVMGLRKSGVERLAYAMAFPPCASFMWPENRALEALRAQLDLQFRKLEAHGGSLICPENVSGYGLVRDAEVTPELLPSGRLRALRVERLLFLD